MMMMMVMGVGWPVTACLWKSEDNRQLGGIGFLLPSVCSGELNSGSQARKQVPLLTEPFLWLTLCIFNGIVNGIVL